MNVGDIVICLKNQEFSDGSQHKVGDIIHVKEGNIFYFNMLEGKGYMRHKDFVEKFCTGLNKEKGMT